MSTPSPSQLSPPQDKSTSSNQATTPPPATTPSPQPNLPPILDIDLERLGLSNLPHDFYIDVKSVYYHVRRLPSWKTDGITGAFKFLVIHLGYNRESTPHYTTDSYGREYQDGYHHFYKPAPSEPTPSPTEATPDRPPFDPHPTPRRLQLPPPFTR